MAVFKCKMCGGNLEFSGSDKTVGVCEYCGTRQTITQPGEPKISVKETVIINAGSASAEVLLKRAFMFLEDRDWAKADDFCEQVLNLDPENGEAYLGKLMAELRVNKEDNLVNCAYPFDQSNNYQKIMRYGDASLVSRLKGYIESINERNEKNRMEGLYNNAVNMMNHANDEASFKSAAYSFKSISGYKDADILYKECCKKAEESRKDAIYANAKSKMQEGTIDGFNAAIEFFRGISGWRDSDEQLAICEGKISELKLKEAEYRKIQEHKAEEERIEAERRKKKRKRVVAIVCPLIAFGMVVIIFFTVFMIWIRPAIVLRSRIKDISNAEVGDYIKFGQYEQDNDTSNGKEEIIWEVLDKEDGKLLVVSHEALDVKPYNTEKEDVTWETCSLRKWLNNDFYNEAFSDKEKNSIPKSIVTADDNTIFDTNPGNNTKDFVFLLSMKDVDDYFIPTGTTRCKPTKYAKVKCLGMKKDFCRWWLRTPGEYPDSAVAIESLGAIISFGFDVDYSSIAVRPALWINP